MLKAHELAQMPKISVKIPIWPKTSTDWGENSTNWFTKFTAFCISGILSPSLTIDQKKNRTCCHFLYRYGFAEHIKSGLQECGQPLNIVGNIDVNIDTNTVANIGTNIVANIDTNTVANGRFVTAVRPARMWTTIKHCWKY